MKAGIWVVGFLCQDVRLEPVPAAVTAQDARPPPPQWCWGYSRCSGWVCHGPSWQDGVGSCRAQHSVPSGSSSSGDSTAGEVAAQVSVSHLLSASDWGTGCVRARKQRCFESVGGCGL